MKLSKRWCNLLNNFSYFCSPNESPLGEQYGAQCICINYGYFCSYINHCRVLFKVLGKTQKHHYYRLFTTGTGSSVWIKDFSIGSLLDASCCQFADIERTYKNIVVLMFLFVCFQNYFPWVIRGWIQEKEML